MFLWFRRLVYGAAVLAMLWTALVYALPWAREWLPGFCARQGLGRGICSAEASRWLERLDYWQRNILRPLPRDARVRQAVVEAQRAFKVLQEAIRERVGSERLDAAVRGADLALVRLEGLSAGGTGDLREKLSALPGNARDLLARVRVAFERLRSLLGMTSRRAGEVSTAVEETRRALDALLRVVPSAEKTSGRSESQ